MISQELNNALEDIVGVVDKIDEALTNIAQVQVRQGLRRTPLHDAVNLLYKAKRQAEAIWNNLEIEAGLEERPEAPGEPQFQAVPVTYPARPASPVRPVRPASPVRPARPAQLSPTMLDYIQGIFVDRQWINRPGARENLETTLDHLSPEELRLILRDYFAVTPPPDVNKNQLVASIIGNIQKLATPRPTARPMSPPRTTLRPTPQGDLRTMTVARLRDMAKTMGLRGYSGKTKDELVAMIEAGGPTKERLV